jgi:NAD(P)-dependent dehydrogenase (short-subunit alcohol dehydrogenase family)
MNKTILITGASRGIGAATAIMAAKAGYQVCLNYLQNEEAATKVVDTIQRSGGIAKAFRADVSIEKEVIDLFKAVDDFGQLYGLVNNVGVLETQMRVEDMTVERVQRVISKNIVSCFLCTKEAIKRMSAKHGGKGGSIVNISSVAARTGSPGEYVDYAASKGAIDTFTMGVAKEVAAEGIRVNCVRPGFIYTDIHTDGGEPARVDRLKDGVPMKRGGQPEEIANAILWFLSENSSYSTGSFIDAAGGR